MKTNLVSKYGRDAATLWVGLFIISVMLVPSFSGPLQASDEKQGAKVEAQEVVIDVVARDKKGNTIIDLKESDVEIQEDGIRQKITGFHHVGSDTQSILKSGDPLLQKVKLVTMVFRNQFGSNDGKTIAKRAANEFLKIYSGQDVLVGLFTLDKRFCIVQQYTNKKEYLMEIMDKAIAQDYEPLLQSSEAIKKALAAIAGGGAPAQADHALGGTGNPQLDVRLAQMTGKLLSDADAQPNDQGQWRTIVFSLQSLVRGQQVVPGRKTIFFFDWGLWIPRENLDQVARLENMANRAHVSFYPVYLAGLSMWSQAKDSANALKNATDASRQETKGGAVGMWGATASQAGESAITANALEPFTNLGRVTSGILLGDSNDFAEPMQAVFNDINNYYEISYKSQNAQLEGKYRKVSVKISRAKTVLARSGYYAVSDSAEAAPAPAAYEAPLIALLDRADAPHTFDFRLRVPHFESKKGITRHMLLMEVPMSNFTFAEDAKTKTFQSQFALMAVFKDANGKIVEKVSQQYPFQVPPDQVEAYRKSNILLSREVQLPAGKYTVETVAYDKPTEKSSVYRTALEVAAAEGLQVSSLNIIKRAEPIKPNDTDTSNPFRLADRKISPFAEDPVKLKVGSPLMIFLVVYTDLQNAEKPQMKLQISQNGSSLGEIPVELPARDAQGRMQYTGTLPTNSFAPGQYELKVIIIQGSAQAEAKTGLILVQ